MKYSLLVVTVPFGKAELISASAVEAGSFGGTVFIGRKISASNLAAAFGLGESKVEVVYIVVEENFRHSIQQSIIHSCENKKVNFGTMFKADVSNLVKTGNLSKGDKNMNASSYELITVILNRGYADDAMAAARKAGAGGGTVVNARGTAREDDAKFFGMHIVPEKEMLMIVVESEKKDAVLEAIKTLPCLSEPGSGIAFCSSASDFTLLGKTK